MAETEQVNVLRALQEIRVALIEADIKKSGHNDYSNYDYFELSDFLPVIQKLALEHWTRLQLRRTSCIPK